MRKLSKSSKKINWLLIVKDIGLFFLFPILFISLVVLGNVLYIIYASGNRDSTASAVALFMMLGTAFPFNYFFLSILYVLVQLVRKDHLYLSHLFVLSLLSILMTGLNFTFFTNIGITILEKMEPFGVIPFFLNLFTSLFDLIGRR
jgi:hypothetical protein